MRKRFTVATIVATCVAVGSAGSAAYAHDRSQPTKTIAEIISASGGEFDHNANDYDLLLNAVKTADLVDALNDPNASLAVFAPRDSAFVRLARDLGYTERDEAGAWTFLVNALTGLGNGNPIPVLKSVLLYHVVPEALRVRQVLQADTLTTLADAPIHVDGNRLVDADPDVRDARITRPFNITATNGVVHTITRVLLPVNL